MKKRLLGGFLAFLLVVQTFTPRVFAAEISTQITQENQSETSSPEVVAAEEDTDEITLTEEVESTEVLEEEMTTEVAEEPEVIEESQTEEILEDSKATEIEELSEETELSVEEIDETIEGTDVDEQTDMSEEELEEEEVPEEDLPQLPMPTNLHWDEEHPGILLWDTVEGAEYIWIHLYKDEVLYKELGVPGTMTGLTVSEDINESGTYTFEICAAGTENESADSEWAICAEPFVYERPEKELAVTSKTWWDETIKTQACWNAVENASYYEITLNYNGDRHRLIRTERTSEDFANDMKKSGKYSFTVRALSRDITQVANGKTSEESAIYNTSLTTETVDSTLDEALEIVEEEPDAAIELIKNLNREDLVVAMQTDESVWNRMQELEDIYSDIKGIAFTTEFSNEVDGLIDTSMLSLIGAVLNTKKEASIVKMCFSMPEKGSEIQIEGSQYRKTFQFDINLIDEENIEELNVPIRFTFPIPDGFSNEDTEILHYHEDGNYELLPFIWNYDGTVSFTVTRLGSFVVTEKYVPITEISSGVETLTMKKIGDRINVMLGLAPRNASIHLLKVESLDESVVTVDTYTGNFESQGIILVNVTAVGKGRTVIKISTLDGKISKEIPVNVVANSEDEVEKGDFWVELPSGKMFAYTGKQIKPMVNVYDGTVLLEKNKDYTVSYENNIKVAYFNQKKDAPTIVIKGKGDYSGTETIQFSIYEKSLMLKDVLISDITVAYNGKSQKKVPEVIADGRKLKNNVDFTVSYPNLTDNPKAYKEPGTYTVLVQGKGGYVGTREVKLTITESKFMSKVTVSKIAAQPYTGEEITTATMNKKPVVKFGDKKLTEGTHYTVSYENNVKVGTATMTLTGTDTETPEGTFTGIKKVTFKITGTSLAKATVTGVPKAMTYTGLAIDEETEGWGDAIKVVLKGKELTRAEDAESEGDYIVTFSKNTNKGTATVTVKGINAYSGSVKKEFAINAYNINDDAKLNLVTEEMETETVYVKGGTKPEPVVKFGETTLVKGKDYTLTYANNTKWNDGTGVKKPTVTITGKGNFKGSVKLNYTIAKQDLDNLSITASDVVYKKEKGAYKTVPVVKDLNNKALKNKTDFTVVSYTYGEDVTLKNKTERKAGDAVGKNDIVPAGTLLKVTVAGKGSYANDTMLEAEYRVVKSGIAKATVKVTAQKYTGEPITIEDKALIKVKVGKTTLAAEDFEIVEGSFKNNTKAGTASFMIEGVGNYGGTKKVTFKIKPKGFTWWWSK